jgi:small subunit ribosomal protein S8
MARRGTVSVPASKIKVAIAEILKREGFIHDYVVEEGYPSHTIVMTLKYTEDHQSVITGIKRVSKPGLRIYTKRADVPRVRGGLGVSILSTPKGVLAGHEAVQQSVGGEVLCYVW